MTARQRVGTLQSGQIDRHRRIGRRVGKNRSSKKGIAIINHH